MAKRRRPEQLSMLTLMGPQETVRVMHAECCRIETEMRDDDGNVTTLVMKPDPAEEEKADEWTAEQWIEWAHAHEDRDRGP